MKRKIMGLCFFLGVNAMAISHFPTANYFTVGKETVIGKGVVSYQAQHHLKGNGFVSVYDLDSVMMTLEIDAHFDKAGFFQSEGTRKFSEKGTGKLLGATKLKATGYCADNSCAFDFKEEDGTVGHETLVFTRGRIFRTGYYDNPGQVKAFWEERGRRH